MISHISSKCDYRKPVKVLITKGIGGAYDGVMNFICNTLYTINHDMIQADLYISVGDIERNDVIEKLLDLGTNLYIGFSHSEEYSHRKEIANLKTLMIHRSYHCIHINSGHPPLQYLHLFVAKKCGIPVRIAHSHNTRVCISFFKGLAFAFLKRYICITATHFLACSELAGIWLFGRRVMHEKGTIIRNGIDIQKFSFSMGSRNAIRANLGISKETLVIGLSANFTVQKNHQFLLRIFSEIHKLHENSVLLLVGDGAERGKIISLAHELCVYEKVCFVGSVKNANEYYSAMDIFVMPSLFEGLPYAGIEAQTSGLPCIFSDSISSELAITEYAHFYSLNNSPSKWACETLEIANRVSTFSRLKQTGLVAAHIKAAGYDFKENTDFIACIYTSKEFEK